MEREEIVTKLTVIFRTVFNNQSIVISNEMTANDVENWDSLTHMLLINEVENSFSIKFKLKDLLNMKNVGELIDIIKTKIS
jgi:acyl carrier protein